MKKATHFKFAGIIPARYASSRFPGKPLALIGKQTNDTKWSMNRPENHLKRFGLPLMIKGLSMRFWILEGKRL